MIKKYKTFLFFFGLLVAMEILHVLLLFVLRYLDFLSYDQEGTVLLIGFQIILILGILLSAKRYHKNLRFRWERCDSKVVFLALFLSLLVFILSIAMDTTFFNFLTRMQLKFIKFDFTLKEGFYWNTYTILSLFSAPILEEVLYRRIIFRKLAEKYSVRPSIFLTAFLFALLHLDLNGFLAYFFVGLVYTYLYHLTGRLWLNILVHALFNFFASITIIEIYRPSDPLFNIGFLVYIICAVGIFLIFGRIRFLMKAEDSIDSI